MSQLRVKKPVYAIIDQAESYPFVPPEDTTGLAIANDGNDTVTVIVNDGDNDITIKCTTANRSYDADFKAIKSISATGSAFQIELRGV